MDNSDGAPWYTEQPELPDTNHWGTSNSHGAPPQCGANSRFNDSADSITTLRDTTESATWTPLIREASHYEVYWSIVNTDWTDANALYVIHPSQGSDDSMRVNQQFAGLDWHYLGTYYFDVDTSGYVRVVVDTFCTGPVVRADCIFFKQADPPPDVSNLVAQKDGTPDIAHVHLTWTPLASVYYPVDYYTVFRNSTAGFTPSSGDSLGLATGASYVDSNATGVVGTNYYYVVHAVDTKGNKSGYSDQVGEFDKYLTKVK